MHTSLIATGLLILLFAPALTRGDRQPPQRFAACISNEGENSNSQFVAEALQLRGYTIVRQGKRGPLPCERIKIKRAIAKINKTPGQLFVYLHGKASIEQGQILIERKTRLRDLLSWLGAFCRRHPTNQVFVLLDLEFAAALPQIHATLKTVQVKQTGVAGLCIRLAPAAAQGAGFPLTLPHLCRTLAYAAKDADANQDRQLSFSELLCQLRGDAGPNCWIRLRQDAPLFELRPLSLEQLIFYQSLAIVNEVKHNQASAIQVVSQRSGEVGGPLEHYVAQRVKQRLQHWTKRWPAPLHVTERVVDTPAQLGLPPRGQLQVVSQSSLEASQESLVFALQANVKWNNGHELISRRLPWQRAILDQDESAMSGKINMAPDAFQGSTAGAESDWLVERIASKHPLTNPDFPIRVYIERLSDRGNQKVKGTFSKDGRQHFAKLNSGEKYAIVIENHSPTDLFVRLLVDGRNTLPDRTSKNDDLQPASYVSLTKARCWFVKRHGVFRVRGFYHKIDSSKQRSIDHAARLHEFLVVRAPNQAKQHDFADQLGVITAAFYSPVLISKSSMNGEAEFATEMGMDKKAPVSIYQGSFGPGSLVGNGPINIRYGFGPKPEKTASTTSQQENNNVADQE